MAGAGPTAAQIAKVRIAQPITAGTNQPATRSASFWIGARERPASLTMRTICASKVALPICSARMMKLPI